MSAPYSVYCHIPFCVHRCAYCDFNTYARQQNLLPAYTEAMCREIMLVADAAGERLTANTIFFGGGTPSLVPVKQYEAILAALRSCIDFSDPEITLEANPGTISLEYLMALRTLGFNRISLGVQSTHPEELRQLERIHDHYDVMRAVQWARQAGFKNLNIDLIFGLPEQTLERWVTTIKRAVDLQPEHLSLYALTIEDGTPLGRWAKKGLVALPNTDMAADMYEWATGFLDKNGYVQYEISNWARNGEQKYTDAHTTSPLHAQPLYACQHNLQVWRNLAYLGFGAGAHGFAGGIRYSNVLRIRDYLTRLDSAEPTKFPVSPAVVSRQTIDNWTSMQETMLLGLRLTKEGVSRTKFHMRYGVHMEDVFAKEITRLLQLGLVEWEGEEIEIRGGNSAEILHLTENGRLLGNQVFAQFVD